MKMLFGLFNDVRERRAMKTIANEKLAPPKRRLKMEDWRRKIKNTRKDQGFDGPWTVSGHPWKTSSRSLSLFKLQRLHHCLIIIIIIVINYHFMLRYDIRRHERLIKRVEREVRSFFFLPSISLLGAHKTFKSQTPTITGHNRYHIVSGWVRRKRRQTKNKRWWSRWNLRDPSGHISTLTTSSQ